MFSLEISPVNLSEDLFYYFTVITYLQHEREWKSLENSIKMTIEKCKTKTKQKKHDGAFILSSFEWIRKSL